MATHFWNTIVSPLSCSSLSRGEITQHILAITLESLAKSHEIGVGRAYLNIMVSALYSVFSELPKDRTEIGTGLVSSL